VRDTYLVGSVDIPEKFPVGNALAILVLIGMLVSVGGALVLLLSPTNAMKPVAPPL
jgi:hypothetical protein